METLLATKFNIPPTRPQLVLRPRLIERLQKGLRYNLILVSAPAGFGKTTLLNEWARQVKPPVCTGWLSLDEGDNDPIRFWDYFIAALQTIHSGCGEIILPWLHSYQLSSIEPLLTALINDLSGTKGDFAVVLDDYHLIESQQIHDGIAYLIEHMPAQIHLIIASRADPLLPLAHFRGKGMMLEIRTDDLRFTLDDAASLMKELKTPELSAKDIAAINERTEGWVVGLKMAALSMKGQKDIPGFIAAFTGSQRYVMDYLMEEVLRKQSQEVLDFLLKTSVLERLSGLLCDAVTGWKDSQHILRELERRHLFIVPLDETRQWYRYEHLFADLLRHQCEATYGEAQVAALHRQASEWYEDNNIPDEAVHHALEAKDWDRSTRLVKEYAGKKLENAGYITVLNWLQKLPEEIIHRELDLLYVYGATLNVTGKLDAASSVADYLEMVAESDNNELQGNIANLRSITAFLRGDIEKALELGKKALSLLPSNQLDRRLNLSVTLGHIYFSRGLFKDAAPLLMETYESAKQVGNKYVEAASLSFLGEMDTHSGKLRRAAERHHQAVELAGLTLAGAGSHHCLSGIFYEWNDLEAAIHHVQKAIELGQLMGSPEFLARCNALLARYRLARGDENGMRQALEKACLIAHDINQQNTRAEHAAFHIQLALRQDDLTTASEWGKKLAEDAGSLPFFFDYIPARLLIAQGEKTAAATQLQALYEKAIRGGSQSNLIRVRFYQALVADNEESGVELLAEVLAMAEPEGYIRTFVDEGKLLAPLLRKAIPRGIMPDYAGRLLTIIQSEKRRRIRAMAGSGLLSERELEILRLLASDISNQRIAEKLFISTGTVKLHVHNILEKLGARSRSQAVDRAREMNII